MLGKLLGLLSLGEALSKITIPSRLISILAVIFGLTIMGAIIAGALALFGLYECHAILVRHGLDADIAALFTGFIGLLILLLIAAGIVRKIKEIKVVPFSLSQANTAGATAVAALRGFFRGLTD